MNLFDKVRLNKAIPPFLSGSGNFVVDDTFGISLLTSIAYKESDNNYLIVVSNLYKAQKVYDFISSIVNKDNVILFPNDELIRAEYLSQSKEMVSARIFALNEILNSKRKIVITNISAATKYLPKPSLFNANCLSFSINQKININEIKKQLVNIGYSQVSKIDQSLQFASRGDILDIFSVNSDYPIRIELFGDEIESIREFEISTQLSIKKLTKAFILPANEFLLTEEEYKSSKDKILSILNKDKEHLDYSVFETLFNGTYNDLDDLSSKNFSQRLNKYYGLLTDNHYSLFDYCKNYKIIIDDVESIKTANSLILDESTSFLNELHEAGKIISHLGLNQDINSLVNFKNCIKTSMFLKNSSDISFNLKPIPFQSSKTSDAINIIKSYINENYEIHICANTKEYINLLSNILEKESIKFEYVDGFELPKNSRVSISLLSISNSFVLEDEKIVCLTCNELFNEKVKVSRFDSRFKSGTILKTYEDLQPGDYVVHEYQGIGQFLKLETLDNDGVKTDYLKIAYHSDEILYVPLVQFQLVRKYLGKEGVVPRLSRLHSKDWENTKRKIKERVNELAERLFNLYVERNKVKGFQFQKDDEFQKQFEEACPFKLTKDQEKSLTEIKSDMESTLPMDRLLCGDVGFGKTEVAFRAIFKAILSGKQVALLCPTTLLAKQHYERAIERFRPFDVEIAVFSRLISQKKQKEYIDGLKSGKIHLAIGTHRLLSKDIEYKDLGLLVVDEEQRFGVEQKERLKELKSNIDVLTLSATPIPRTLQISLLGVRQLSQINTAPQDRMPIQTYVIPFKQDIVKELIQRELGRDGQVFYLHNNVATLYECASRLQRMLPGVTIGVAHGQMDRDTIEDVMNRFYSGEISVLVCTSIIENGIDIPNANMIIVEDSENYGLSQLYQIKGRVGRSDRIAYAYLMYNENKMLKEKAQKRLKAIQDFTELGSGYKIAQRDLMIRGAGDILGPDQAGFIDSIGLDLYIKLLNEAVKEKKGEKKVSNESELSLKIDSYIPSDYASDSDKIELYQEILSATTTESLLLIKKKAKDVFGKIPREVELIFIKRNIDILMHECDIKSVKENRNNVEINLGDNFVTIKGIGNILFELLIPYISSVKISYVNRMFKIVVTKSDKWLNDLENILYSLVEALKKNKIEEIV